MERRSEDLWIYQQVCCRLIQAVDRGIEQLDRGCPREARELLAMALAEVDRLIEGPGDAMPRLRGQDP